MGTNYKEIILENLGQAFSAPLAELASRLGAREDDRGLVFKAFGKECHLGRDAITLGGRPAGGPEGVIISLYALKASSEKLILEPFKAFRELPGSMPYQGAFAANTERVLLAHVPRIKEMGAVIMERFSGHPGPEGGGGDFSFVLYPLPKIALAYIFYLPDEEFPASATCLFSANALSFMPLDGLADVGEYTSKAMIDLVRAGKSQ